MSDWRTIVSVAAEGGSIKLLGKERSPGQWVFRKSVNERMLDDWEGEVEGTTGSGSAQGAGGVKTWEEALQLLDRYPWHRLNPQEVHPAFGKLVWNALQKKMDQNRRHPMNRRLDKWSRLCFSGYSPEIVTLATWLQQAKHTTVLTGAGMSTESNIPDFRSKDGWWRNIDPRTVATVEALDHHYDLFHDFYKTRIEGLEECFPHKGHEILADWERKGFIHGIATQNVDGFHTAAGNQHVYELHGSIHKIRCAICGKGAGKQEFLHKKSCSKCGGKLRPGVVLFGEMLPEETWRMSLDQIEKSDLVIVIGTSLEVYPASQLPQMTKGKTVYLNAEVDANRNDFDLVIEGRAGEVLKQVEELLI